jgi:hypothetical protein
MEESVRHRQHVGQEQDFFSSVLPRLKLAIGEAIDRDNAQRIPARYRARLGRTRLDVVLHPAIAGEISHLFGELEADLADSVARHALMYERQYALALSSITDGTEAPFSVIIHSMARDATLAPSEDGTLTDHTEPAAATPVEARGTEPEAAPRTETEAESRRTEPEAAPRTETEAVDGWKTGQWRLHVLSRSGEPIADAVLEQREMMVGREPGRYPGGTALRLPDNLTTVSRRQLVVQWDPGEEGPAFRVYNTGKAHLQVNDAVIPGANIGEGLPQLGQLRDDFSLRISPGARAEIGRTGPIIYIEENEKRTK